MIRQIQPWFENLGKRVVKASKVYFRDSGILHALLGLKPKREILSHPKLGFSWEGHVLEEVIHVARAEREAYFYRTHAGAELNLLLIRRGRRYGFEFKYEAAPRPTKSMHIVTGDLNLKRLWVVTPGEGTYALGKHIELLPLTKIETIPDLMG
jgi:predicted AAA+ superfamily ATPase